MPLAYYSVGRELLGRTELDDPAACSIAYLCDQCGPMAWATITIPGASWSFEFARCEKHPDPLRLGRTSGSLLRPWDCTRAQCCGRNLALALECLPERALTRELNLLLKEISE